MTIPNAISTRLQSAVCLAGERKGSRDGESACASGRIGLPADPSAVGVSTEFFGAVTAVGTYQFCASIAVE
eukprot:180389-Rhodomonas_salina.1